MGYINKDHINNNLFTYKSGYNKEIFFIYGYI